MSTRIPAVITVRTSSSRLPGKCLLPFGEGNVIEHVIRRARHYGLEPIVCTSIDATDDVLVEISEAEGVHCFRGSLVNKLKRWADCAAYFGIDRFHTVDADDPFFDGEEVMRSMALLADERLDMVCPSASSSSGGASVGYSLTTRLVSRAVSGYPDDADTEMAWYCLESVAGLRSRALPDRSELQTGVRLTLDYEEDYWLLESVRRMVGGLASRSEVEQLFVRNPDLYKVNWFRNEQWKQGQLAKKPDSP